MPQLQSRNWVIKLSGYLLSFVKRVQLIGKHEVVIKSQIIVFRQRAQNALTNHTHKSKPNVLIIHKWVKSLALYSQYLPTIHQHENHYELTSESSKVSGPTRESSKDITQILHSSYMRFLFLMHLFHVYTLQITAAFPAHHTCVPPSPTISMSVRGVWQWEQGDEMNSSVR